LSDESAALEAPQAPKGEGFSDAVTIAFGDVATDVYAVARIGLSGEEDSRAASGLALIFAGGTPVAVQAEGGVAVAADGWSGARAAGVSHEIIEPLERWKFAFKSEDGKHGFSVELEALSDPAELDPKGDTAKLGGMAGYEQLVRVHGEATVAGKTRKIAAQGQRGHSWGAPDWEKISVAKTVTAWLSDDSGVTISSVRPAGQEGHGDEAVSGFLMQDGQSIPIDDPRLSTTFDGEGRQRSAGLELFIDAEDDFPHRAAGEVICGTTLDLGRLRMDSAFLRWRMEGREGVGRYDVLTRVG
jgi:hypothetical protein